VPTFNIYRISTLGIICIENLTINLKKKPQFLQILNITCASILKLNSKLCFSKENKVQLSIELAAEAEIQFQKTNKFQDFFLFFNFKDSVLSSKT